MFIVNSIKNTNPLILHHQGRLHDLYRWNKMANLIIKDSHYIYMPEEVTVVTYCTSDVASKSVLIRQLEMAGVPFMNLAESFEGTWKNKYKIKFLYESLYKIKSRYILSLDATDVLLCEDLTELIKRFDKYKCKILYGASRNMYPKIDVDPQDRQTYGEWKYLNSGTMLGETEYVNVYYEELSKEVNKKYEDPYDHSEQFRIRNTYMKHTDIIKYDYKCRIFQTLANTEYDLYEDTLVRIYQSSGKIQ